MTISQKSVITKLSHTLLVGKTDFNLQLKKKEETPWCKALAKVTDAVLGLFTDTKRKGFMDRCTTIGNVVYFPQGWTYGANPEWDLEMLRHELVHVRQFSCLSLFGSKPVGVILFLLLYVLLPVPLGLAWFRYNLERKAFLMTIRTRLEIGKPPNIDKYVDCLTGPLYGYAWPFKRATKKWFEDHTKPLVVFGLTPSQGTGKTESDSEEPPSN